ncbi:hypothetical protein [Amycolatopsis sp. NPDC098790]|uniref:hypothetical protein n=1 Tax=Amycolatopsis sp. NPDC098790 TaxID=3363939 RepID=UPI00380ABCB8
MDVREPALPVGPWLPGEPTAGEVAAARAWLARRGVRVWLPTRLLSLRLGSREWAARTVSPWFGAGYVLVLFVSSILREVPGRLGLLFIAFAVVLAIRSREGRRREEVAERWAGTGTPPAPRDAVRQLGGWFLTATAITFAGGAALCAAMIVLAPGVDAFAQTAALAAGAGVTVAVVGRILRAPVIAEDAASRAVDALLRAHDAYRHAPSAVFAIAALPVTMGAGLPGWLEWTAVAYAVVALGTQLTGWLVTRRRELPPGFYGR